MAKRRAFQDKYLSYSMVAFVDLLGFSDKVRMLETTEELEALEEQVRRVQEWFQHRPQEAFLKQEHKYASKTVLAFSDCVVVSIPLHSELAQSQGDFDVLMSELSNLAMAQGRCVVNGIFVRGAADLGMWYRRKDTLISSAMVNAYHLEHAACVPMIALTDDLYEHLSKHKHRDFYSEDVDPLRFIKRFDDLPNGTSQWLVDYLPMCLESVDGNLTPQERVEDRNASPERKDELRNKAFLRDIETWARWHADEIKKAFAAAGPPSVKAKYIWLADYHDKTVSEFLVNPPAEALIGVLA